MDGLDNPKTVMTTRAPVVLINSKHCQMHNKVFASQCLLYFQILFCFWTSKQDNGFKIFWNISLAWSRLAACRIVGLGDVWDSQTNHTVSGGYQQFQYFPWSFSYHTVFGEYQQFKCFQWSFRSTPSSANISKSNIFNDFSNHNVFGEYQRLKYFWWSFIITICLLL